MLPTWDPEEAQQSGADTGQREHSRGMISIPYRRPAPEDVRLIIGTETFRRLHGDRDDTSAGSDASPAPGDVGRA